MQVTETKTEGLKREFNVLVPAGDIENMISDRLKELGRTARVPGFRPGKVPTALLRKQHGAALMGEILEKTVNESSRELLTERGLRPALQPKIEITAFDEGKDLEYSMALEVMPEIEAMDYSAIKLERLVAEPAESDVEQALERLAAAHKSSTPVTTKRKAKDGDVVVIDFVGSIDGEEFPGGKADDYPLELGPGFEEQLVGVKVGDHADITVTFPEEYQAAELAGKETVFSVEVKELKETAPSTVDDDLAKKVGLDDLDALKKTIRADHEREFKEVSRMRLKRSLLDMLSEKYTFEIPEGLADSEFESIWNQFDEERKAGKLEQDEAEAAKSDDEHKAEFRDIAARRVRLALVLADVGRLNNIQANQEDINRALANMARRYPGQEKMVMDYFRENKEAMESIVAPIFEEKVVDFIVEMATITDKSVSIEDLMKDPDEEKAEEKKKPAKKAAPKKKAAKKKAEDEA